MKREKGITVYIPSIKKGRGTGHLRRGLKFLEEYGNNGYLWLPDENESVNYQELFKNLNKELINRIISNGKFPAADLIITDLFRTERKLLQMLASIAPVVGIDEGGSMRSQFSFLIDTLPNLHGSAANITDYGFNHHGYQPLKNIPDGKCILASFGGEDPAGLTEKTSALLNDIQSDKKITVIAPQKYNFPESSVEIRGPVENLALEMRKYSGVITSFGLTAMEAAFSGIPCLTINPSAYHQKLAEKAGFEGSVRTGKTRENINRFLAQPEYFINRKISFIRPSSLSGFIKNADFRGYHLCPVCRSSGAAIVRTEKRRYARCLSCGLIFMFSFNEKGEDYSESYFDSEYKNQYGRTYLEDFKKIEQMGRRRLEIIRKIRGNSAGALLDIGCAYGPFLKAARDFVFDVSGCDVSLPAVNYVKKELGIPAWQSCGSVPDLKNRKWSVISMWYVIEHLEDLDAVLKKLVSGLESGGVFAFSSPSCTGISSRRSLKEFLGNGPKDHFTVWSPASAKKILKKYGFSIRKTVVTGHHPERFGIPGCRKGAGYRIFMFFSKLFKLGDTFEIYACRHK